MNKTCKTPKGTELPILDMRGKPYLQVAHRLVWFREEHPDYSIETELVSRTELATVAKATIRNDEGRILATAHKHEDKQGFADHMEKAETGAIGRALALIGYGTQFCADEFDEGSRLADSPITRPAGVYPAQPEPGDGNVDPHEWTFSFGQWRQRTVESVYNDPKHGPKALASYITYLEESAKKKNENLSARAEDAITHIACFLGAMENRPLEPGERE